MTVVVHMDVHENGIVDNSNLKRNYFEMGVEL